MIKIDIHNVLDKLILLNICRIHQVYNSTKIYLLLYEMSVLTAFDMISKLEQNVLSYIRHLPKFVK